MLHHVKFISKAKKKEISGHHMMVQSVSALYGFAWGNAKIALFYQSITFAVKSNGCQSLPPV